MTDKRSYAIIGTGALGGYYGICLHRSGRDVHFLLHSDADFVKENGLVLTEKDGPDNVYNVKAYGDVREMPACDVAIVALKTTANCILPEILPQVVKPDGVVLVLQNGLGVEDAAAQVAGPDRVYGGLCFLCSNKTGPGRIHYVDYGHISMGRYRPDGNDAPPGDTLRAIAADFEGAGIDVELMENLEAARWRKLVWNIPYNGLSVILRTTTDRLMADPSTRGLVERVMREVVALAAARGHTIEDAFVQKMMDYTDRMTPYRTSMMIDFDLGRPLEIDAIYGEPLRRGESAGGSAPLIRMIYDMLRFLTPS